MSGDELHHQQAIRHAILVAAIAWVVDLHARLVEVLHGAQPIDTLSVKLGVIEPRLWPPVPGAPTAHRLGIRARPRGLEAWVSQLVALAIPRCRLGGHSRRRECCQHDHCGADVYAWSKP